VGRSDIGPRATHLLGIVVCLRGASGNALYWVLLLLAYAGPREHTLLCIVVSLMWGFGQHTSLGIVVGLCGASGNTLLILGIVVGLCASSNTLLGIAMLLVYVRPWATHPC
jgi:hypothetical protein